MREDTQGTTDNDNEALKAIIEAKKFVGDFGFSVFEKVLQDYRDNTSLTNKQQRLYLKIKEVVCFDIGVDQRNLAKFGKSDYSKAKKLISYFSRNYTSIDNKELSAKLGMSITNISRGISYIDEVKRMPAMDRKMYEHICSCSAKLDLPNQHIKIG